MKKAVEFIKRYKNALIVAVLILSLILICVLMNGEKSSSTLATGASAENKTVTEIKLQQILSGIEGVGQADVMINEGEDGIEGVVIVCEGANSIMTRNDILSAVSTALNVNRNNIAIYAMNIQ